MSEKQREEERRRQLGKKVGDLEKQLDVNEGRRIRLKMRALNSTYNVFMGNYHILVRAVDYLSSMENALELFALDNRDKLEAYMADVTRLFHNFLAGAKTLVDHTRVFKNEMYEGKSFDSIYQAKRLRG